MHYLVRIPVIDFVAYLMGKLPVHSVRQVDISISSIVWLFLGTQLDRFYQRYNQQRDKKKKQKKKTKWRRLIRQNKQLIKRWLQL